MGKVKKNSEKNSNIETKKASAVVKQPGVLGKSVCIKKKSKREKFSQKRKNLRLKLASSERAGGAGQKNKKRRRKPKAKGTVDIKSLKDALPSLESLVKFRSAPIKTGVPEYDNKTEPSNRTKRLSKKAQKIKRITSNNEQHVARLNKLQFMMQDRMFKENPRQIIAEHIENTRRLEDEMDD